MSLDERLRIIEGSQWQCKPFRHFLQDLSMYPFMGALTSYTLIPQSDVSADCLLSKNKKWFVQYCPPNQSDFILYEIRNREYKEIAHCCFNQFNLQFSSNFLIINHGINHYSILNLMNFQMRHLPQNEDFTQLFKIINENEFLIVSQQKTFQIYSFDSLKICNEIILFNIPHLDIKLYQQFESNQISIVYKILCTDEISKRMIDIIYLKNQKVLNRQQQIYELVYGYCELIELRNFQIQKLNMTIIKIIQKWKYKIVRQFNPWNRYHYDPLKVEKDSFHRQLGKQIFIVNNNVIMLIIPDGNPHSSFIVTLIDYRVYRNSNLKNKLKVNFFRDDQCLGRIKIDGKWYWQILNFE